MIELIEALERLLDRGIVIEPEPSTAGSFGGYSILPNNTRYRIYLATPQPSKDPGPIPAEPRQQQRGW